MECYLLTAAPEKSRAQVTEAQLIEQNDHRTGAGMKHLSKPAKLCDVRCATLYRE